MLTAMLERPAVRRFGAALGGAVRRFPRAGAVVAVLVTLAQATAVASTQWGVHQLLVGLPSIEDVRRMGEMAQATVFYDVADAPAFTIFDERRFDVSLADVSPHLVKALLADRGSAFPHPRWCRRRAHRRRDARQPARGSPGAGRQHPDPAARPPELPDPRQDLYPQGPGSAAGAADRAPVHQGRDPRAVSQQDVLRRRALRRRGGGDGLLRQAGPRAVGGRSGAARRPGEVAVHLGAHGQHGTGRGAPQRRAAGDARRKATSTTRRSSAPATAR